MTVVSARFDKDGNCLFARSLDGQDFTLLCKIKDGCYYIKIDGQKIQTCTTDIDQLTPTPIFAQKMYAEDGLILRFINQYGVQSTTPFSLLMTLSINSSVPTLCSFSDVFDVKV